MGSFDPSLRTLMLDEKAWLTVSTLIHPKGVLSGWGQDSVQASQVLQQQTRSSMSLWTLLCVLLCSRVGTGRGHPQTVSTLLGTWNCPKSLGMLKHSVPKKQPHTIIPPPPILHLAQCSQTSIVLMATTKPRLLHQIVRRKSVIRHSRELVSTALESSGGVLYTTASDTLHCTWWCITWMQLLGHGNPFH